MKRKLVSNRIRVIALVAILLGMVFTSLAYFTDRAELVNTFTIGKIEIELDEPGYDEVGNHLATLLPGRRVTKDPTVTVLADSEDTYVFMHVLNNLKPLIGHLDVDAQWRMLVDEVTLGTLYVYIGTENDPAIVLADTADQILTPLFTEFTVPTTLDNDNFRNFDGDLTILVSAYAHQAMINGVADFDTAKDAALAHFGY